MKTKPRKRKKGKKPLPGVFKLYKNVIVRALTEEEKLAEEERFAKKGVKIKIPRNPGFLCPLIHTAARRPGQVGVVVGIGKMMELYVNHPGVADLAVYYKQELIADFSAYWKVEYLDPEEQQYRYQEVNTYKEVMGLRRQYPTTTVTGPFFEGDKEYFDGGLLVPTNLFTLLEDNET